MSGLITTFDTAKWMRQSINFPIDFRPCRIEDMEGIKVTIDGNMTDFSGDEFKNAMSLPNVWKAEYPNFQQALDAFIMRKGSTSLILKKTCSADSLSYARIQSAFAANAQLEYFFGENASSSITFTIGDVTSPSEYIMESIQLEDHQNSTATVIIRLRQPGEWLRLKTNYSAVVS
ncbi:MAG: hypothetical protein NT118_11700 [Lentisphaerae bacterium]|nr:hypothetical protein [Lentisphaerota bacterium]